MQSIESMMTCSTNRMVMKTRVVEDINDPFLKSEWKRLERQADIFPQSSYDWCATWWKYLGGKRKLHVVMVIDQDMRAVGIAPLCIERYLGVPVLRSFPIHFTDFYSFITEPSAESSPACKVLIEYILSGMAWKWVRLEQVAAHDPLCDALRQSDFIAKRMTGCVVVHLGDMTWDDYLGQLSSHFRKKLGEKMRRMNRRHASRLHVVTTWEDYKCRFDRMLQIHERRWIDDHRPAKGAKEKRCWQDAIEAQFHQGRMIYYELMLDEKPVAYRLGFLHGDCFYAWHTGFDPDYSRVSPGVMITALMMQYLIAHHIRRVNFMAGDYDYKLRWCQEPTVEDNYMFTSSPDGVASRLLNSYHHEVRDDLKALYHRTLHHSHARYISRNIILVRDKLKGRR